MAGVHLLLDERLGRRHEDDLPSGVPPEEVVHHDGCYEGLAQSSWETDLGPQPEFVQSKTVSGPTYQGVFV